MVDVAKRSCCRISVLRPSPVPVLESFRRGVVGLQRCAAIGKSGEFVLSQLYSASAWVILML